MKKEMTDLQPLSSLTPYLNDDFNKNINQLAANHKVVIFYIPRQDKEILTIMPSILKHISLGYEVHLVSYSVHSNEEFKLINQKIFRQNRERNQISSITRLLDKQTFINDKNNEFIQSSVELGVRKENIHIYNSEKNASISELVCIIRELENRFPLASHRSLSFVDEEEHSSLWGKALIKSYEKNVVTNVNFYIKSENKASVNKIKPLIEQVSEEEITQLKRAAYSYRIKKASESKCTKSYIQLKESFERFLQFPVSYVHGPTI
ncbi:hypothetical protein AAGG74_19115 [Bacillus mexicanus]|uniref:hypothetical protein n=1 Tax=Bacillus mexicanus TaxID=2834415 RepID=UPI003D19CA53